MGTLIEWGKIIAPILIALIGIIPTIKNNANKTNEAINCIGKRVDEIDTKMANHIREDEENQAKEARVRILRFYDELCEGKRHSENHYEETLDDIDIYEKYCASHPDYHNNKGKSAMKAIVSSYETAKRENDFLTHEK